MNETQNNEPRQDWRQDTLDCWQRLPNKVFFFVLLAAWAALFQFLGNAILGYVHTPSLFAWLYSQYNSPAADDGHGNFIPLLVVGLFWWKRKELLALPLNVWWPGLLILAAALALHVVGYAVQQVFLSVAALFIGLWGLMGLAWGRAWLRHSVFPFFLFVFSIPLGQRAEIITFPLRRLVSWLAEVVAHYVLGLDVIRMGTQLFNSAGTYGFDVEAPCSGMRSLIATFLLATIYGFFSFSSNRQRLLLMALAVPFSILGNLLRLLLIIITAEIGGQDAGNYIHHSSIFSLVPYIPAIVGLLLVGRWLEKQESRKTCA
jgi:exosortase